MAKPTAYLKDVFREIRKTRNRFLSIFAIIALGTGFFVGIKATCPDMKLTATQYYDDTNLMDLRLLSTFGFTSDDVEAIRERDDVEEVLPTYSSDFLVNEGMDNEASVKVFALHDDQQINQPQLLEGRMPEAPGECVVDNGMNAPDNFKIGNTITLSSEKDGVSLSDTLDTDTYTIVGIVQSPLYIDLDRGTTNIGNGTLDCFIMVPEEDFVSEYYTDLYLTLTEADGMDPFSDEYEDLIDRKTDEFETFSKERAEIRYEDIYAEASEKLEDAKQELADGQAEFDQKIQDAQNELNDAKRKLESGQQELNQKKADFESTVNTAKQQLEDGTAQLDAAQQQLDQQKAEYESKITQAQTQLDQGYAQLEQAKQQLEQQAPMMSSEQLVATQQQLEQQQAQLDASAQELEAQKENGSIQLEQSQAQIDQNRTELQNQQTQLDNQIASAPQQFADAQADIDSGWEEYNEGLAEFQSEKAEGEQELADGQQKIRDAEKELNELEEPKWYVFDRSAFPGHAEYGTDAERVDNVAKVFPLFFILVALLVCLTTMTRMVEEHRTQIGTMKALGYSRSSIISKYLIYSLLASLSGSIVGITICSKLFPTVIYNAYRIIYCNLPDISAPMRWNYMLGCTAVAVLCTSLAAIWSCYSELFTQPAQLMRPKSPPAGKRILLERWTWFWNKLSFIYKVTIRNIFRYKKRVLMTVIGIAGCTALMLTGFGLQNAISSMVPKQFDEIFLYDAFIALEDNLSSDNTEQVKESISKNEHITNAMLVEQKSLDVSSKKATRTATLFVPENPEQMENYIVLKERVGQSKLALDSEGVILTEKLAKLLDVQGGDTVRLTKENGGTVDVSVTGITENYVTHYVYMSPELYEQLFVDPPEYNMIISNLDKPDDQKVQDELASVLISDDNVLAVSFASDMGDSFQDIVKNLNYIVLVIIISAGALAFIVLYNLVNVNVAERTRELATIKVLGFYDQEVSAYIYRENIFCTLFGIAVGLFLGVFLERFVVQTAEVDMVMFMPNINVMSFVYASALTLLFTLVVNITLHFHLKKLDMVESLKSIE